MIVLIRNKNNGIEHVEKHVIAITEEEGHIVLVYDDYYGMVTGCKYPLDTYEVVKFKKGAKTDVD